MDPLGNENTERREFRDGNRREFQLGVKT
jgi:hypothetical protein